MKSNSFDVTRKERYTVSMHATPRGQRPSAIGIQDRTLALLRDIRRGLLLYAFGIEQSDARFLCDSIGERAGRHVSSHWALGDVQFIAFS